MTFALPDERTTTDRTLHLWGPVKNDHDGTTRSYAPCGIVVGSFTHDPDKVQCTDCIAHINKENDSDTGNA